MNYELRENQLKRDSSSRRDNQIKKRWDLSLPLLS